MNTQAPKTPRPLTEAQQVNLAQFTGTERYYRYAFGLVLTDGAKAFSEKFQSFWFLDVIGSYQHKLAKQPFQVWYIAAFEGKGEVTCEDGNGKKLLSQDVPFTTFPDTDKGEAKSYNTLWCINDGVNLVVMLPSEY